MAAKQLEFRERTRRGVLNRGEKKYKDIGRLTNESCIMSDNRT